MSGSQLFDDNIPNDIIWEILIRTDAPELFILMFRSTCKDLCNKFNEVFNSHHPFTNIRQIEFMIIDQALKVGTVNMWNELLSFGLKLSTYEPIFQKKYRVISCFNNSIYRYILPSEQYCEIYPMMAIHYNNLELTKLLVKQIITSSRTNLYYRNESIVYAAAHRCNIEIIKFLINSDFNFCCVACRMVARRGRLDIIKVLYEKRSKFVSEVLCVAAFYGHVNIVEWMLINVEFDLDEVIRLSLLDLVNIINKNKDTRACKIKELMKNRFSIEYPD